MPISHHWRCDCGEVLDGIGIQSLSLAISTHNHLKHGYATWGSKTYEEIEKSPQYWTTEEHKYARPQYTEPNALCSGRLSPSFDEHKWLKSQGISWVGDARTPDELSERYKPLA